jgi:hypothetical protein
MEQSADRGIAPSFLSNRGSDLGSSDRSVETCRARAKRPEFALTKTKQ